MTDTDKDDQLIGRAIACRLRADAAASPPRIRLTDADRKQLETALHQAKLTCEAPPALPAIVP